MQQDLVDWPRWGTWTGRPKRFAWEKKGPHKMVVRVVNVNYVDRGPSGAYVVGILRCLNSDQFWSGFLRRARIMFIMFSFYQRRNIYVKHGQGICGEVTTYV